MTDTGRDRAAGNYRKQLRQRGLSANRLRATIRRALTEESQRRSGIYAALRCSPLVGTGLRFRRERTSGR